MNFEAFMTEDRRQMLLSALKAAVQYRSNALLLRRYCEAVGHSVSSDRLAQDLAWLREQGLVTLQDANGLTVATITARGMDVATGVAEVPGVSRPQPGY